MPTYEYACGKCDHEFEREQRITDDPVKTCPKCRSRKVQRLISRTSFVLKGSGWYSDLYSSSKDAGGAKDADDKGSGKSSDSTGDSKSESSSDSKSDSKGDSKSDSTGDSKKSSGGKSETKSKAKKGKGTKAA